MATLINVDGSTFEVKRWQHLATQQQLVGGWIEEVRFDDGSAFIVDEEGRLKGLPVNGAASLISLMKGGPEVVGPVLFLSSREMSSLKVG